MNNLTINKIARASLCTDHRPTQLPAIVVKKRLRHRNLSRVSVCRSCLGRISFPSSNTFAATIAAGSEFKVTPLAARTGAVVDNRGGRGTVGWAEGEEGGGQRMEREVMRVDPRGAE